MRRSDRVVMGALLLGFAGLLAWLALTPRSPMLRSMGLPGPSGYAGNRRCGAWYTQTRLGWIPSRKATCEAPVDPSRPRDRQEIEYDELTRRVSHVQVTIAPRFGNLAIPVRLDCGRDPPPRRQADSLRAVAFIRYQYHGGAALALRRARRAPLCLPLRQDGLATVGVVAAT